METTTQILQNKLLECRNIIYNGYTSTNSSGIPWLNNFCAELIKFANILHKFLIFECCKNDDVIETMFLCLTQINTCIRHMELTIKSEESGGRAISASRQHFLDRIVWCLDRIKTTINSVGSMSQIVEESNFVMLMDKVLESIAPFSSFLEGTVCSNKAEQCAEAMFASKEIRSTVDQILSHTLAFANVALKNDKKIISILCQKTIRNCMAFQEECSLSEEKTKINENERKLKAMSLENSLYQLEDFINESLLRLVFHTFLDYSKLSVQKLREAMQISVDDSLLDEVIADFDVNIDRTTQIGVFAIAFAPNVKIKTAVRSCLASLESLDSCIIPSLQSNSDIYSEILEQHFNEEVQKFKVAIQKIIDSNAFCTSYLEVMSEVITANSKQLDKEQLSDLLEMGIILKDHLHLNYRYLQLQEDADKQTKYEKFILMLEECQAILACLNQVDSQRVIKRFKILRSVLSKFRDSLADSKKSLKKNPISDVFITSDEMCESERLLESVGIAPSTSGILYRNDVNSFKKSDSLRPNYSRMNTSPNDERQKQHANAARSIRRKDSLRTTMFKKAKSNESQNLYKLYREQSHARHLSEILNDITALSVRNPDSSLSTK
ncbi:serendipity locus protein alpha [Eupeodes corollae]|uniref:serendipity locus protein alpha n=1 Tax=Eupeodes corollae TaxID=290404 RepID=UPI0024936BB1|nr:serendipity locus protein alpha [Eupeodes corollae]